MVNLPYSVFVCRTLLYYTVNCYILLYSVLVYCLLLYLTVHIIVYCTVFNYTVQSKGNAGIFQIISSLCASGYWLSSAARVTSDYMEDNILVYSTFNLVITLTMYITSAWHIHISIPKINVEDKKIQKNKNPKSYFHWSP